MSDEYGAYEEEAELRACACKRLQPTRSLGLGFLIYLRAPSIHMLLTLGCNNSYILGYLEFQGY